MASLLDRLSVSNAAGPVRRNKSNRGDRSPYVRPDTPPKGNVESQWTHDMFDAHNGLGNRISDKATSRSAPKINAGAAMRALNDATGTGSSISIKGASIGGLGNVVEVRGLVAGTSADDVKAIFQQCGPVTDAKLMSAKTAQEVVVRIVYKHPKDAQAAVNKFDGQNADGRKLSIKILGAISADLSHRLGNPPTLNGSVDALIGGADGESKMRSDAIIATDARAAVLVAPPGTNPAEYTSGAQGSTQRGGPRSGRRGRGGRGGRGGRKGRGGATMDVD